MSELLATQWTIACKYIHLGFPNKNTGVGCHISLLQGDLPDRIESESPGSWRFLQLNHQGKPKRHFGGKIWTQKAEWWLLEAGIEVKLLFCWVCSSSSAGQEGILEADGSQGFPAL